MPLRALLPLLATFTRELRLSIQPYKGAVIPEDAYQKLFDRTRVKLLALDKQFRQKVPTASFPYFSILCFC